MCLTCDVFSVSASVSACPQAGPGRPQLPPAEADAHPHRDDIRPGLAAAEPPRCVCCVSAFLVSHLVRPETAPHTQSALRVMHFPCTHGMHGLPAAAMGAVAKAASSRPPAGASAPVRTQPAVEVIRAGGEVPLPSGFARRAVPPFFRALLVALGFASRCCILPVHFTGSRDVFLREQYLWRGGAVLTRVLFCVCRLARAAGSSTPTSLLSPRSSPGGRGWSPPSTSGRCALLNSRSLTFCFDRAAPQLAKRAAKRTRGNWLRALESVCLI